MQSLSKETRSEVNTYNEDSFSNILKLQNALAHKKFHFSPSKGFLKNKGRGKKPRPLVVSKIDDRIVRRAILDTLQEQNGIKEYLHSEFSFGGTKGSGVKEAIISLCDMIDAGNKYYIKSDIPNFFPSIPKEVVLSTIAKCMPDNSLDELLQKSLECELYNACTLEDGIKLFPSEDYGVAQGCCLSPLIGNILLDEFDKAVNNHPIRCIRYMDDFIIIGKHMQAVENAFSTALHELKKYGMSAYKPDVDKEKASKGSILKGVEFLGCYIDHKRVQPNKKSRDRFIDNVKELIAESEISMRTNPDGVYLEGKSFNHTIRKIDNLIKGWGNSYYFCNDKQVLESIDSEINNILTDYCAKYSSIRRKNECLRRQLLGVHPLANSKRDPIIRKKK